MQSKKMIPYQNTRFIDKTKLLIIDDHAVVRQGLTTLINQEPDLSVCGEAENVPQAMSAIQALQPDMAIVDLSLGGQDGIELIKNVVRQYHRIKILVLSMHHESFYGERALRAGANGYITKHEAAEMIIVAIRQILKGEVYLSERIVSQTVHKFIDNGYESGVDPVESLTDRELEVFRLIGRGYESRRIAEELHLCTKTVETYRTHLRKKLHLTSTTELAEYAFKWIEDDSGSSW